MHVHVCGITPRVPHKWNIHKAPYLQPCKGPHKNLEAKCVPFRRALGMGLKFVIEFLPRAAEGAPA